MWNAENPPEDKRETYRRKAQRKVLSAPVFIGKVEKYAPVFAGH